MAAVGIDVGNYSAAVATVGRGGTHILSNSLSNHQTPSLVVLGDSRRYVGEEAASQRLRHVEHTASNCRSLLGMQAHCDGDGSSDGWQQARLCGTATGGIAFRQPGGNVPVEAAVAACLADCMTTASAAGSSSNHLVVLAAPAWAPAAHRLALDNAATVAGLNLVDVLSEVGACALFYATERLAGLLADEQQAQTLDSSDELLGVELGPSDEVVLDEEDYEGGEEEEEHMRVPADNSEDDGAPSAGATVLFVDVGHGGTTASLVCFSGLRTIEVLDVRSVPVGGRELDALLADHFVEAARAGSPSVNLSFAAAAHSPSVRKTRQRLLLAAEQTKKVLSTNESDTQLLEEIAEGVDMRCDVSRTEFEEAMQQAEVLQRILAPITAVLEAATAGETTSQPRLSAVELFGGTARVPAIERAVLTLVGDLAPVRRSLNGVDGVARGCALRAAMALPSFNRSRALQLVDASPWAGISLVLCAPQPPSAAAKGEASKLLHKKSPPTVAAASDGGQSTILPDAPERPLQPSDTSSSSRVVVKPVLKIERAGKLPSPAAMAASARLSVADVLAGLVTLELRIDNGLIARYAIEVDGPTVPTSVTISESEPPSVVADNALLVGEYGFLLQADGLSVIVESRAPAAALPVAEGRQPPDLRAVRLPGATDCVADMNATSLAELRREHDMIVARERAVATAEAARNELESTVYVVPS